jgi:predicted SnoaL-like aldol condensation-catalyzing enzyme
VSVSTLELRSLIADTYFTGRNTMNAKKIITLGLLTMSLGALVSGIDTAVAQTNQGKTRDEVKAQVKTDMTDKCGTSNAESNKALVIKVLQTVLINRDTSNVATYFARNYIQHNPRMQNGVESMLSALPKEFHYELGMVVAQGDLVMVHGRYTGWGPKPVIAVDIFRVAEGKLAEHWDVLQVEVPASSTASGNPMFVAP